MPSLSLMTIGFGDFVPGKAYIYNLDEGIEETEANAKLVLGAIYILLGMGIIAMCVNLMQEKIITEVKENALNFEVIICKCVRCDY